MTRTLSVGGKSLIVILAMFHENRLKDTFPQIQNYLLPTLAKIEAYISSLALPVGSSQLHADFDECFFGETQLS